MLTDTPISVFRNARHTEPVTAPLGAFLASRKWRGKVEAVRAIADKKARDEAKKDLPAATISGVFSRRAADGLQLYNGLVCLDFDAKENPGRTPKEMREILRTFDEVAYAGLSVSGQGVFAVIATNNTDPGAHAQVVDLLGSVLAQYDIYYDRACKDVCRLRFVSYDPEGHWNPNPTAFDAATLIADMQQRNNDPARRPRPVIIARSHPTGSSTEKKVEQYLDQIEARNLDLTTNYDDWMRLGMALATEFGTGGEHYFHRISAYHPKYDHIETAKKFADFVRNARQVHIGTFFHLCNAAGIRL